MSLYSVDVGTETLIEARQLSGPVPAGQSPDSILFILLFAQVGSQGLLVRIDDDGSGSGAQNECNEVNHQEAYSDRPC